MATELALVAPAFVILLALFQLGWRTQTVERDVRHAAARAARAASLGQDTTRARADATRTARAVLDDRDITCRQLAVAVVTSRLQPAGTVAVTVTCTADLSDLALLAVPGTYTATATRTEVVDTYRAG